MIVGHNFDALEKNDADHTDQQDGLNNLLGGVGGEGQVAAGDDRAPAGTHHQARVIDNHYGQLEHLQENFISRKWEEANL